MAWTATPLQSIMALQPVNMYPIKIQCLEPGCLFHDHCVQKILEVTGNLKGHFKNYCILQVAETIGISLK